MLRPSLLFGVGDGFFTQLVKLIRWNPVVPVAGDGRAMFQPHAIGDDTKPAQTSADGTSASAAVDIVKLQVLNAAPQLQGADIRIGHMEGSAKAAAGGIDCPLPVSKTANVSSVTAGPSGNVTYTITIPSSIADFNDIACDLQNISADDTASVQPPGGAVMNLTSADHGGVIDRKQVGPTVGQTGHIGWANLGNYKKGSPPIVLRSTRLRTHLPWLPVAGGGLLLGALGLIRGRRRLHAAEVK